MINIVLVGATAVMSGDLTLGTLMTFTSMAGMFMDPIGRLVVYNFKFKSHNCTKRLSEYLMLKRTAGKRTEVIDISGDIKIENLTFRYEVEHQF